MGAGASAEAGKALAEASTEDVTKAFGKLTEEQQKKVKEALTAEKEDKNDQDAAAILQEGHTRLVSSIWLLQRDSDYVVQSCQSLLGWCSKNENATFPALVPCNTAANYLLEVGPGTIPRVLVLSYRWLTRQHPDPSGVHLAKVRLFLEQMLLALYLYAGFQVLDVGTFWDFMSLPQSPRTESENETFKLGLKAINKLYGSKSNTLVLQLVGDPDGEHPYELSGWCQFEQAVASIQKRSDLLIAIASEEHLLGAIKTNDQNRAKHMVNLTTAGCQYKNQYEDEFEELGLARLQKMSRVPNYRDHGPTDIAPLYYALFCMLAAGRKPPMHPVDMQSLLTSGRVNFTNGSDVKVVNGIYLEFFLQVAADCQQYCVRAVLEAYTPFASASSARYEYTKQKWGDEDIKTLAKALGGTEDQEGFNKCEVVDFEGLELTLDGAVLLTPALQNMKMLETIVLPGTNDDKRALDALRNSFADKCIVCSDIQYR